MYQENPGIVRFRLRDSMWYQRSAVDEIGCDKDDFRVAPTVKRTSCP